MRFIIAVLIAVACSMVSSMAFAQASTVREGSSYGANEWVTMIGGNDGTNRVMLVLDSDGNLKIVDAGRSEFQAISDTLAMNDTTGAAASWLDDDSTPMDFSYIYRHKFVRLWCNADTLSTGETVVFRFYGSNDGIEYSPILEEKIGADPDTLQYVWPETRAKDGENQYGIIFPLIMPNSKKDIMVPFIGLRVINRGDAQIRHTVIIMGRQG